MLLTFEFSKPFGLSSIACCVVLKIRAYTFYFFMMKNNKKYSLVEKEKLAENYIKYKEEYDNQEKVEKYKEKKKRKFAHSSTNTTGFISKAVREIYPSLRNNQQKPVN